ncbi:MAG TPA: hypothetical protein VKT77_03040, partial [Chthonomonadaceae bacterium]|nr:hypothetical protein [Chthonomonadaceae bacterium]
MRQFSRTQVGLTLAIALAIAAGLWRTSGAQTDNTGPTTNRFAFQSTGIRADEAAVVTVVNPNQLPPPRRIRLLDSDGKVAADSGEFLVAPNATVHFTISYASLNVASNRLGRKQFRVVVTVSPSSSDPGSLPPPCRPGL